MIEREVANYKSVENVHDLPAIFHYWSNRYLRPKYEQMGFSSPYGFFLKYLTRACTTGPPSQQQFISIGSGNCDTEVSLIEALLKSSIDNFVIECLDVNPSMLERGQKLAQKRQVLDYIRFTEADINSWTPNRQYQAVIANQSLHHFVELETLFDKVLQVLSRDGFFLADDIIGRNGHMRWPEALKILKGIWRTTPEKYKFNHQLKRLEIDFDNWDCSREGFEGVRAQDILPLLIRHFQFELFIGFGNLIDAFVDRSFGHNFDAGNPEDTSFIDRVHLMDEQLIERGTIKPTHMTAVMRREPVLDTLTYKHLTPSFCVRWPTRSAMIRAFFREKRVL